MKKRLLPAVAALLVLIVFAPGAAAQYNSVMEVKTDDHVVLISSTQGRRERPDKMSIRVAGYELMFEQGYPTSKKFPRYYGGRIGTFEIGFNGFRELPGAYDAYPESEHGFMDLQMGKSIHVTFNLWTFSTTLTRNNTLGVTAAIGFTANNYRLETTNHYVLTDRTLHPIDADQALKKAKMTTFAIHFPLALEVNPARNFFFSVGGWVDLVTGSHMKWKSPKGKLKHMGVQNFLQAGSTVRIGFKNAYVFGSYNFAGLFRHGRGPAVNPYTLSYNGNTGTGSVSSQTVKKLKPI